MKKTYNAQKVASTRNDWFKLLERERQKYELVQTDEQISKMSKYQFKSLVNKLVRYSNRICGAGVRGCSC